jgi:SAM-dependent methyltransferase
MKKLNESMETVNCDFCRSDKYSKVVEQTDIIHRVTEQVFSVVKCDDCGLHFTNPRPNRNYIGNFYSTNYSFHGGSSLKMFIKEKLGPFIKWFANSPLAIISILIPPVSKILVSQVKPHVEDPVLPILKRGDVSNFLDIGCGSGRLAHFWGRSTAIVNCGKYTECYAVEPDKHSRNDLDMSGIKSWSEIRSVEQGLMFDLIRMNWSLEHVHSPTEYFSFIQERLTEKGIAVICVPNNEGLLYKSAPSCLELPIHLYHFSLDDIRSYADKFHLEISDFRTFSYPAMYKFAAKQNLLPSFSFVNNILQAQNTQKVLNCFDEVGLGNDMIITLRKRKISK